ncbi:MULTISPECIES: hypothetical protein [unclassified Streptomyces]|uniref:hypothetical protein n=1 Tax=unclassified Streptomyces TaxID=2593676 RepID=UPI002DD9FBE2|nr:MULTISPECIES: hypothetical protein [unclassified Streptomyces]WSS46810.1 hypothetical protein OG220_40310 [Streptomyces sp. NBC_01187]WSA97672.1 hypothetical protein OIE63_39905 [Streptomyces sp. NBC_01795]WSB82077.1 hypothetical protein OHB04_40905 [Streptomyces sp. NBC_01775]WSS18050.1 hypothetical protein OG533_39990 [Streptomyces sp. NBC_01186]WSS46973.1 hypothetical protein OG220_41315 [Streptomyces sp. NBC_01187]
MSNTQKDPEPVSAVMDRLGLSIDPVAPVNAKSDEAEERAIAFGIAAEGRAPVLPSENT